MVGRVTFVYCKHLLQVTMALWFDKTLDRLDSIPESELNLLALPPDWFCRNTIVVARELIGTILVHRSCHGNVLAARIVETEAYLPTDPASHSFRGQTPRNGPMFAAGGCLYVYRIYGKHRCINIVTEQEGVGAAVLIRAAEPLTGIEFMIAQRGRQMDAEKLLSGPANLARGFGFDLSDNYRPCYRDGVWIIPAIQRPAYIGVSQRIGISRATDALLRYFDLHSTAVSVHRNAVQILRAIH